MVLGGHSQSALALSFVMMVGLTGCSEKPVEQPPRPAYDTCFMLGGCSMMVFFPSGGAAIDQRSAGTLRQFASAYRAEFPTYWMFVAIEGHAGNEGSPAKNESVAEMRARAVRDFLMDKGLPYDRLQTWACANREPLNGSPAHDFENRRVIVQGTKSNLPQKQRSNGCRLIE
jgi:outer membrane protein OmpA-like peptidoglycan-associated protein